MGPFAQKLLFAGGLALAVGLLGITAWQFGWFGRTEVTSVEAPTLIEAFAEDGDTAAAMFNGERLAVRGNVTEVNSTTNRAFVVLGDIDHRTGVRCMFDGIRAARLMDVVLWQEIVVEGTMTGYRNKVVILEDCRVVSKEKNTGPL